MDVTQPARFSGDGQLVNPDSHRITGLTLNGKPVKDDQPFILATNNYRAFGGGNFAGTGEAFVAFASPDENRQILADYISRTTEEKGQVVPGANNNWSIAPINSKVDLSVVVETAPGKKAETFIQKNSVYKMEKIGTDKEGFAVYQIDLSEKRH
ncbi:5'-nucleotidase C-terminal domain-containing protein [Endozoicomonas sp. 8E]|uniref:5'-nucleotidase C-terminal domain-containing protein n=1 Tax=Endozoicomonas sp. 8E TaxID=3035692 RepID=UPI002938D83D|nr:5'-nucleotidase C-terminal domain-containing protein [Endozoicomonas sp. 8E]WOG30472.1 5'-nucleotidase C-terminal domain-containing protein [Endozoicomonas sp. 8E]